jgi:dipeptide/tripeptide permease
MIKVINLVSLLAVPLIVSLSDHTAFRLTLGVVGVIVLGGMVWYSKSRKVEKLPDPEMVPGTGADTTA